MILEYRLHHIAIQTRDMEKSLYFYGVVLGLKVIKKEVSPKGRAIVWFMAGEGRIELYGGKPSQPLNRGWNENSVGPVSLGFLVASIDRTVQALRDQGVPVLKEPYEPVPGERAAMISGPDGEEIVLLEKPVGNEACPEEVRGLGSMRAGRTGPRTDSHD
ncbi:MAG: VOC family protein [Nitrospirae bacterium]|nr:VOC family protein [Nitrospirota bacterium]